MSTLPQALCRRGVSVAWRALQTSLTDLLGGRIKPVVDGKRLTPAAVLPPLLGELVERVVRRTRLWRRERTEVARELVAHFEDGLAAGVGAEELVASFGDPVQAARLIRRAKQRNRPLTWKAMKFTERAIGALVLLALVVYAVQAVRIYGGRPNLARNYVAEWNAAALAVPEAERAWPVYRAAALKMAPWPAWDDWDLRPGSKVWPELAAYTRENAAAVELFRSAARMPRMAWVLTGSLAKEDELLYARGSPAASTTEAESPTSAVAATPPSIENPPFMSVLLPPLAVLREGARLLSLDAYLAAQANDAGRVTEDLHAILQMADHAREPRILIGDLVAAAIACRGCDALGRLLDQRPQLLDDERLTELAHRLAVVGDGTLRVRFDSERAAFEDMLQRCYTDNGRGGGLPRPDLMQDIDISGPGARQPDERWRGALLPPLSLLMASRREVLAKFEFFLRRYEAEQRIPLGKRDDGRVDADFEALVRSPTKRLRYWPLWALMPSLGNATRQGDVAEQWRDATLVAVALELYRRRHGTWPAALDELAPRWLPQVPPDCYDGKPIKYVLAEGQPVVYSVGVDRDDDGGRLPELKGLKPDAPRRKLHANRAAAGWQPPPDPNQPGQARFLDGDWILWPPVDD
jgi:hypothetical protein